MDRYCDHNCDVCNPACGGHDVVRKRKLSTAEECKNEVDAMFRRFSKEAKAYVAKVGVDQAYREAQEFLSKCEHGQFTCEYCGLERSNADKTNCMSCDAVMCTTCQGETKEKICHICETERWKREAQQG